MSKETDLFAYCGIYCGDCLGYTGVIANSAKDFLTVLEKYQFNRTAKSVFPDELKNYDNFHNMLKFMTTLTCPGRCRQGKDTETSCKVRRCCREKGYFACYECGDLETCDKLKSAVGGLLHYDSAMKNFRAIKEMGLEAWIREGKHHMYWDKEDDD